MNDPEKSRDRSARSLRKDKIIRSDGQVKSPNVRINDKVSLVKIQSSIRYDSVTLDGILCGWEKEAVVANFP